MNEISQVKTRYRRNPTDRIMQGDIFEDVPVPRWDIDFDDIIVDPDKSDRLKFAVVLSQDCDLERDFDNWKKRKIKPSRDKILPSILVCIAYPSKQLLEGDHCGSGVAMVNWKEQKLSKQLEENNHARFHFLAEPTEDDKKNGIHIPSLIVDFKHCNSLPVKVVYKLLTSERYKGSVNELFREELSHRFSSYLSRVGVPPLDKCPPCWEEEA